MAPQGAATPQRGSFRRRPSGGAPRGHSEACMEPRRATYDDDALATIGAEAAPLEPTWPEPCMRRSTCGDRRKEGTAGDGAPGTMKCTSVVHTCIT